MWAHFIYFAIFLTGLITLLYWAGPLTASTFPNKKEVLWLEREKPEKRRNPADVTARPASNFEAGLFIYI
jgi:hypothetical protein